MACVICSSNKAATSGVGVAVGSGSGVGVKVGVAVGTAVAVGVLVGTAVAVGLGVSVGSVSAISGGGTAVVVQPAIDPKIANRTRKVIIRYAFIIVSKWFGVSRGGGYTPASRQFVRLMVGFKDAGAVEWNCCQIVTLRIE
jgi:hypothetical protein